MHRKVGRQGRFLPAHFNRSETILSLYAAGVSQTEKCNASDGDDDDRIKNGLTPGHADQAVPQTHARAPACTLISSKNALWFMALWFPVG